MQRQRRASPALFKSAGDLQSEVYLTISSNVWIFLKGEPDIGTLVVLKILMLNNTKPSDLLPRFSRVGFFQGFSPKIIVSNVDVFHCILFSLFQHLDLFRNIIFVDCFSNYFCISM